jgi:hypothetical protein
MTTLEAVEHALVAYNPSDEMLADAAESIAKALVADLNERGYIIVSVSSLLAALDAWWMGDEDTEEDILDVVMRVANR